VKRSAIAAVLALVLAGPAAATLAYRGFTIDDSAVQHAPGLPALLDATREQIDIVQAVGLPAEILVFMQGVKFQLVPAGTFKSPTPGRYMGRGEQSVQVSTAIVTTGHKPVLLHELLHAYHDQRIEKGFDNPTILALYREARTLPAYTAKSHMMSNDREFFACTATTYLFGVTAQEPFRREKVRDSQPACHDYLKKLFGPTAGNYAGSLTR
jgi:hypothetical protein